MKRFKQFLTEGEISDLNMLMTTGSIPFSEKMWSRITGSQLLTMYGLHVTDTEGVNIILRRIIGRKKSLPVMDDVDPKWITNFATRGMGILTDGGVFLICEGKVLATFGEDVGSARDKQGRRWIEAQSLPQDYKLDWFKFIDRLHTSLYATIIEVQDGNPERQEDYGVVPPDGEDPAEYWRSNDIWSFDNILIQGTPLEKQAAIVMYIEGVEAELKTGNWDPMLYDLFKYGGQRMNFASGEYSGREMWNEMFMIDTKIIKAMILTDSDGVNLPLEIAPTYHAFDLLRKSVRNIEYYHRQDKPIKRVLETEIEKITQLNNRIRLNLAKGFKFPTDY